MEQRLKRSATELAQILASNSAKVIFAESCTAGLVSASLAGVPGISQFLCGSLVTYRESAKMAFLDVDSAALHEHTAVSQMVTEQMAVHGLSKLPEADWAAAVTGHLGPNSPVGMDGNVFVAVARRHSSPELVACRKFQLGNCGRYERQMESACHVLELLAEFIQAG